MIDFNDISTWEDADTNFVETERKQPELLTFENNDDDDLEFYDNEFRKYDDVGLIDLYEHIKDDDYVMVKKDDKNYIFYCNEIKNIYERNGEVVICGWDFNLHIKEDLTNETIYVR